MYRCQVMRENRRMRHITMVLWLLLCFIPCAAQNKQSKPDLSGTWVFDQDRSYPTSKREPVSAILTIVHHDPEIRITTKLTLGGQETVTEVVLYTDGRGEWNAGYTASLVTPKLNGTREHSSLGTQAPTLRLVGLSTTSRRHKGGSSQGTGRT